MPETTTKNPPKKEKGEKTPSKKPGEEPRQTPEEAPEEKPEEKKEAEAMFGGFFANLTIEGAFMLAIAALVDVIGWILLCFGLDDFWVLDVFGTIFIGGWMLLKSGTLTTTTRTQKLVKKSGKKILKRFGLAFLAEIIPYVGAVSPSWTIAVYYQIKNG